MLVVRVWHVRVAVYQSPVPMRMRVRLANGVVRRVLMLMVLVMNMRVFVLHVLVNMRMLMMLTDV